MSDETDSLNDRGADAEVDDTFKTTATSCYDCHDWKPGACDYCRYNPDNPNSPWMDSADWDL